MKRILILIALLLVSGCGIGQNEFVKYEQFGKRLCTNQTVWDERTSYEDFKCDYLARSIYNKEGDYYYDKLTCIASDYILNGSISDDWIPITITIACEERRHRI